MNGYSGLYTIIGGVLLLVLFLAVIGRLPSSGSHSPDVVVIPRLQPEVQVVGPPLVLGPRFSGHPHHSFPRHRVPHPHHRPEHHRPEHHRPEHHRPEHHQPEHHQPEHHQSEHAPPAAPATESPAAPATESPAAPPATPPAADPKPHEEPTKEGFSQY